GHGLRIATLWQSVAQLQHRYGGAADDILANSTAKLFMGPITDETTRQHVLGQLGDEQAMATTVNFGPDGRSRSTTNSMQPKATAAALQQIGRDRALLLEGRTPPALVRVSPWWSSRD